jgi:phytanoyl-CoA hydroxylase
MMNLMAALRGLAMALGWRPREEPEPTYTGYRSPYGGLWIDRDDAPAMLRTGCEQGKLSPEKADRLESWRRHGYIVIEGAVPHDVIDRLNADIDAAWAGRHPRLHVEHWRGGTSHIGTIAPDLRSIPHKLLDLHSVSEASRQAIFSAPIRDFLRAIFSRPLLAFQSLTFERGTQQPVHQDAAYVAVSSLMEFAAAWIALEDIQPGSGELEYYEGSHQVPSYLFGGRRKRMPPGADDHGRYLSYLHEEAARLALPLRRFLPKKGDALVWSADLAHGGAKVDDPGLTRRSLVAHYCPADVKPGYFGHARVRRARWSDDCEYSYQLR